MSLLPKIQSIHLERGALPEEVQEEMPWTESGRERGRGKQERVREEEAKTTVPFLHHTASLHPFGKTSTFRR